MRWVAGIFALALAAAGANLRLYLTDGTYQIVREYHVEKDRVRFYSTERSEWEEIPLTLVDLKRTEQEVRARREAIEAEARLSAAEEKAERQQQEEVARVPMEAGVYLAGPGRITPLKQAEAKAVTSKRRSILKVLTPVPIVAGKATVELDGPHAALAVPGPRPEFYLRRAAGERFGIFRLTAGKDARVVQKWTIVPVTKEIFEEQDEVEVFRQQLAGDLYKIWPTQSLTPGEYAVVEYTQGRGDIQVWDFGYRPSGENP